MHTPIQTSIPCIRWRCAGSILVFGEDAWSLRLPAVLFGIAGLWALYHFARRMAPGHEPLLAVSLLAVSYYHVWFSQNARGYTGLLFWAVLGSSLFVRNLQGPRIGLSVSYAAVMALALYTHLTALFVVAAHGLIYLYLLLWKSGLLRRVEWSDLWPLISLVFCGMLGAGALPVDPSPGRGFIPHADVRAPCRRLD